MNGTSNVKKIGAAIAIAAASMLASGCTSMCGESSEHMVKYAGLNTCKGSSCDSSPENSCKGKKHHRQAYHFRILWAPGVDECSDKLTRIEKHDESHDRHEGPAQAIGSPPGANNALMISRTIGKSHPDGRCLSEPQRYHEADR